MQFYVAAALIVQLSVHFIVRTRALVSFQTVSQSHSADVSSDSGPIFPDRGDIIVRISPVTP